MTGAFNLWTLWTEKVGCREWKIRRKRDFPPLFRHCCFAERGFGLAPTGVPKGSQRPRNAGETDILVMPIAAGETQPHSAEDPDILFERVNDSDSELRQSCLNTAGQSVVSMQGALR
jgi:hypothetical protein